MSLETYPIQGPATLSQGRLTRYINEISVKTARTFGSGLYNRVLRALNSSNHGQNVDQEHKFRIPSSPDPIDN